MSQACGPPRSGSSATCNRARRGPRSRARLRRAPLALTRNPSAPSAQTNSFCPGQPKCSIFAGGLGARCERVVAVRASPATPGRPGPRRSCRVPASDAAAAHCAKRRGRNRRQSDRLADKSASGLFKHQGEFGEAETEPICRCPEQECRANRVQPPVAAVPARSSDLCWRNPRATFGPAAADKFGGAVAQQRLLRCQMQFHDCRSRCLCQFGRLSTRRASTLRWISDEPP